MVNISEEGKWGRGCPLVAFVFPEVVERRGINEWHSRCRCLQHEYRTNCPLLFAGFGVWIAINGQKRQRNKMVGVSLVILFTYEVERTLLRWLRGYDCCYQFSHCTQPAVAFNYHRLCLLIQTELRRPPESRNTFKRKSIWIFVSSWAKKAIVPLSSRLVWVFLVNWNGLFRGSFVYPDQGHVGLEFKDCREGSTGFFLWSSV